MNFQALRDYNPGGYITVKREEEKTSIKFALYHTNHYFCASHTKNKQ